MNDHENFLKVSCALTGVDELDPGLASQYAVRLVAQFPGLPAFTSRLAPLQPADMPAALTGSADQEMAIAVVQIWYTSEFRAPGASAASAGTAAQSGAGLLWSLIGAPAPATSKGPYAYWTTPPKGVV